MLVQKFFIRTPCAGRPPYRTECYRCYGPGGRGLGLGSKCGGGGSGEFSDPLPPAAARAELPARAKHPARAELSPPPSPVMCPIFLRTGGFRWHRRGGGASSPPGVLSAAGGVCSSMQLSET
eukprot:gene20203-biopygen16105